MFITESGFNSTTLSERFEALVFNTSTQVVVPSGTPPAAVFTKCRCSIKKPTQCYGPPGSKNSLGLPTSPSHSRRSS